MDHTVVTTSSRPDLEDQARAAFRQRWPEFVFHDPVPPRYLPRVARYFGSFDVLLLIDGRVAAGGWGVPFAHDPAALPGGYDDMLVRAVEDHEAGRSASGFCLMAAAVHPDHDRQGLARAVVSCLTERAADAGIDLVVAPLRPSAKHRYPLVSMAEYAGWMRPDGLSIDPWIRTHQRAGARILGTAPDSMVVPGTVAQWETWAEMAFPTSGDYVVPGALSLVHVDREQDTAIYREDNLWVQHR